MPNVNWPASMSQGRVSLGYSPRSHNVSYIVLKICGMHDANTASQQLLTDSKHSVSRVPLQQ